MATTASLADERLYGNATSPRPIRSTALASGLAVLLLNAPLLSREALAACIPVGGTNYACSATNTLPQVILADDANVSTLAGFSVDVSGMIANALDISGMGAIAYTDLDGSPLTAGDTGLAVTSTGDIAAGSDGAVMIDTNGAIRGGEHGIYVENNGAGVTNIAATGAVVGTTGIGIYAEAAFNFVTNTGGVAITAHDVSGGGVGIWAHNDGMGATNIVATGTVTSGGSGVVARRYVNQAGGVTIDTQTVTGGTYGISSVDDGTGATSIIARGAVTGTVWDGITATQGNALSGALTIEAQAVTGGVDGISAESAGIGAIDISAAGLVVGATGDGIRGALTNSANASDIVIDAQAVSGGNNGIVVENRGTGSTSIAAAGPVTGLTGDGVVVVDTAIGGDISVTTGDVTALAAGMSGIQIAAHSLTGDVTVVANGDVRAGEEGVRAYIDPSAATGDIEVTTNGSVEALYGVSATNYGSGSTTVTAAGPIVGSGFLGIHAQAGGGDVTVSAGDVTSVSGWAINVHQASAIGAGVIDVTAGNLLGATGANLGNAGTGATSFTANGTVTGTDDTGIIASATNAANSGGIAIGAQDVSGAIHGILAYDSGLGATSIDTQGTVIGTAGSGIFVRSDNTGNLGGIDIDAAAVNGNVHGIYAENHGLGAATVTATGDVTALIDKGIAIGNDHVDNLHAVTVEAQAVTGGDYGIYVNNSGRGVIDILAADTVTATNGAGVVAWDSMATNTGGMVVQTQAVDGATDGIVVENVGTGATSVTASGSVVGTDRFGIIGVLTNGANASALAIDAQSVSGGVDGVRIRNAGTGATSIVTSGAVVGTDGVGISSILGAGNSGGIIIESQAVSGGTHGIIVYDPGLGATRIDAQGNVIGTTGSGVFVRSDNTANLGGVDIDAVAVSGNVHGIYAENHGLGATTITATGNVTATLDKGIAVGNDHSGNMNAVTVNAQGVSGGNSGIFVNNQGLGAINIVAGGPVQASLGAGIEASNHAAANTGGITIDAQSVRSAGSGDAGIVALNNGSGLTGITVGGLVEGSGGGIAALSANGAAIDITIDGEVRNLSRASQEIAIATTGGPATIANNNRLLGVVQLGGLADSLSNAGTWNTAGGINSFGAGTDNLANQAGAALIAASLAGAAETTQFDGLEVFDNFGRVTLADGGTSDRLEIDGNAVFSAGSVHAADTDASGAADLVLVAGSADIAGAVLDVANQGGYLPGQTFTMLTATGGLSGEYGAVTGAVQSAFLSVEDSYDATSAYLTVMQTQELSDAAWTPNQIATAEGLESLPVSHPVVSALLAAPDDETARAAFDLLSGEIYGSAKTALIADSHFVRDAMSDRLRSPFDEAGTSVVPVLAYAPGAAPILVAPDDSGPIVWSHGFGAWGASDGDGNVAAFDHAASGLLLGVDGLAGDWRLGLLAGYGISSFEAQQRVSSGSSTNYHLGFYGGTEWGNIAFRSGLAYSWHDLSISRAPAFGGFADNLYADYGAATMQAFGELAYRMDGNGMHFEPFANLALVSLKTASFGESGGPAALTGQETVVSSGFATVGLRAEHDLVLGSAEATLHGMIGWRHAYGDTTPNAAQSFLSGAPFTVAGAPLAADSAVVEAGLDLQFAPGATFGLSYAGQFSGTAQDHGFRANLAASF